LQSDEQETADDLGIEDDGKYASPFGGESAAEIAGPPCQGRANAVCNGQCFRIEHVDFPVVLPVRCLSLLESSLCGEDLSLWERLAGVSAFL
jgi:hypothetical protein